MATSRRELLFSGAAAVLSYCLPGGAEAVEKSSAGTLRREAAAKAALLEADPFLTRSVLSGQLRTPFTVEGQRKGMALSLIDVADLPSAVSAGTVGSDLSFAATWSGPASAPLPQQTYRLSHPQLGTFSVFLVPVGRAARVRRYEAVFNRSEA
jgi:hypothetical protein